LSLTVLADPFWGRLPWLLKRRGGNTASREISWSRGSARVRPGPPDESSGGDPIRAGFQRHL